MRLNILKILSCAVLIASQNIFATPFPQGWESLFYRSEGNFSQVINSEFFLTESRDVNDEYLAMLPLIKQNNREVICNFPARAKLISSTIDDLKMDFADCMELINFKKSFKNKYVSIVLSTEYLSAPSSAFGHVMIVLHNELRPTNESDVIHFVAESSSSDGLWDYLVSGITGGYPGYFQRLPFFKKINEYSMHEQRYMFAFNLNLSTDQIDKLLNHLFELRKAKFNYYFFNKNCAYQIDNLLRIALGKDLNDNRLYTLPIDIVRTYENSITNIEKFSPSVSKAKQVINKLNSNEKIAFSDVLTGKRLLQDSDTNILKDAVKSYYQFQFKKKNLGLPNYKINMLVSHHETELESDSIKSPLLSNGKSRFSLAYISKGDTSGYELSFRPVLTSSSDNHKYKVHESELSVMEIDLQMIANNEINKVKIKEVKLLTVALYDDKSKYFGGTSWSFYSGFNSRNKHNRLKFENYFAIGHTYCKNTCVNYMLGASFASSSRGSEFYAKPSVMAYHYFSIPIKAIYRIETIFTNAFSGIRQLATVRYFHNKLLTISISYEKLNAETFSTALSYYF